MFKEVLDVLDVLATGLNAHAITFFSQLGGIHFEPRVEKLALILPKALHKDLVDVAELRLGSFMMSTSLGRLMRPLSSVYLSGSARPVYSNECLIVWCLT